MIGIATLTAARSRGIEERDRYCGYAIGALFPVEREPLPAHLRELQHQLVPGGDRGGGGRGQFLVGVAAVQLGVRQRREHRLADRRRVGVADDTGAAAYPHRRRALAALDEAAHRSLEDR
jgi:hypothetical protein